MNEVISAQTETVDITEKQIVDWDALYLEQSKLKNKKHIDRVDNSSLFTKEILDAYEASYSRLENIPKKNTVIKGTVTLVTDKTAIIDIGYREDGYIDLSKESSKYLDYITPGNDIEVKVLNEIGEKDFIGLSYTDAVYFIKEREILNSIGKKGTAYLGYIKELVPGGYLVLVDEVKTFMPGSLAGVNKLHDFDVMLGQSVYVMAVNFERDNIVVSHRDYLHTLIPGKIEQLKEDKHTLIKGFVTGSTPYGVFCEFNDCLTGMILASDLLDEFKERHTSRNIKPGDSIEFFIKEIISNKKIILTQILKTDPWKDITDRYKVPAEVKGKVTSIKEYGAFIEIEEGVIGLLHSSEYANKDITEGSIIDVKINRIDISTKKIFLTSK